MKTKQIHLITNKHLGIRSSFMQRAKSVLKVLSVAVTWGVFSVLYVRADALTGLYTQVAYGDPDFYGGFNAGGPLAHGLVQSQLGPDGLPVLSAAGITRLGTSSDMNPTTDELLWWSAADPFVTPDLNPIQTDTLPLNFGYPQQNWYVTGQTSDQNFYRTVRWEGTFNMASAGQISLFLQTDDDGWLFIDGTLVTEYHYGDPSSTVYSTQSAGMHRIDIFYDDRAPEYNQVLFSSSASISPVPEPSVITLSMVCFASFWAFKRRVAALID